MKRNLKPGDVISFPSLKEMYPQYVRTECKESIDNTSCLTDIYKINNGVLTSMELRSNIRYIKNMSIHELANILYSRMMSDKDNK